jgi:hypothetical protein
MDGYEKKGVAKWALRKWLKRKELSKVAIYEFQNCEKRLPPPPPGILELRILKGLHEKGTSLRILKDLKWLCSQ